MHLCVLGSSSAGNCTVIWDDHRALLVDCGFGPRYIGRHLRTLGLTLRHLTGVLLTHTHSDHVHTGALKALLDLGVPVTAPRTVLETLVLQYRFLKRYLGTETLLAFENDRREMGPFGVDVFPVPHDAPGGCFGYAVRTESLAGTSKATVVTDLGYPPDGLSRKLADSHVLVIESNHDTDMLASSGRPEWLKNRIRTIGHLSNEQSGRFVREVLDVSRIRPQAVVLAHISKECNTNGRAVAAMQEALRSHGAPEIRIVETFRRTPNEVVTVRH